MGKYFLYIILLLSFVVIGSLYISKENNSLDTELKAIKHIDLKPLALLHQKFSALDMSAKDFNLSSSLEEINKALVLYPLDEKLKTIKMELMTKEADISYNR